MSSKYHHNAIITGYIDSYCLVCESHLRSDDDILGHIAKPIHVKNLDGAAYVDKFKDDCVRKVKKGYFCEFCNDFLTTAAKAGLHVEEETHIMNRCTKILKRKGNSIEFHDILIDEKAWNGLIDDTCAICNTEFDNECLHKTETMHILNLVQNKVEFGPNQSIFRKIDDGSFQCLTCNMVLSMNSITTHFDEDLHKNLYKKCQQSNSNTDTEAKPVKEIIEQPKEKVVESPMKAKVKNEIPEASKKQEISIDTVKREVPVIVQKHDVTKKPAPTEVKKINSPDIKTIDKSKLEKATEALDEEICKALNAKGYISDDENGKKWCLLCDWTLEPFIINNHVNGRHHQTMLKLHRQRLQNSKKCQDFAKPNVPETVKSNTPPAVRANTTETVKTNTSEPEKVKTTPEQENRSKILNSILKFQSHDININFETNTALCKKCSKHVDFNFKSIDDHVEEHKNAPRKETVKTANPNSKVDDAKKTQAAKQSEFKKPQPKSNEDERSESRASNAANKENCEDMELFAKDHGFFYKRGETKLLCRLCDIRVPLKNMKEHVQNSVHSKKETIWLQRLESKQTTAVISTPMKSFIKTISAVSNGLMKDLIINERYCLNILSFFMISCEKKTGLRCEACDVELTLEEFESHKGLNGHRRAMCHTMVIASRDTEFIREVRPDFFHCGYCNMVLEEQDQLEDHLETTCHREAKTASSWRLQQYAPEMMLQMQQQKRQRFNISSLLDVVGCGDFM